MLDCRRVHVNWELIFPRWNVVVPSWFVFFCLLCRAVKIVMSLNKNSLLALISVYMSLPFKFGVSILRAKCWLLGFKKYQVSVHFASIMFGISVTIMLLQGQKFSLNDKLPNQLVSASDAEVGKFVLTRVPQLFSSVEQAFMCIFWLGKKFSSVPEKHIWTCHMDDVSYYFVVFF